MPEGEAIPRDRIVFALQSMQPLSNTSTNALSAAGDPEGNTSSSESPKQISSVNFAFNS